MTQLIEKALTLVRLDQTQYLDKEAMAWSEALNLQVADYQKLAQHSQTKLSAQIELDIYIEAHAVHLGRAVEYLLGNALNSLKHEFISKLSKKVSKRFCA